MRSGREGRYRHFIPILRSLCLASADDIGNYLETRSDRKDKLRGMSHDLPPDVGRIILENMSDMCVGGFGVSPLSAMYTYERLCADPFCFVKQRLCSCGCHILSEQGNLNRWRETKDRATPTQQLLPDRRRRRGMGRYSKWGYYCVLYRSGGYRRRRHALGVGIGSADLDPDNVPALRTLLSASLSIVTVEVSSSTVRPVCFLLQGHLSGNSILFHNPLSTFAEVCFTCLNFRHVPVPSPTLH